MYKIQLPFLLLLWASVFCSCSNPAPAPAGSIADSSVQKGKALAAQYCQLCHMLPDPSLLDKKSWVENVLPGMAPRLGMIGKDEHTMYDHYNDLLGRKYYPSSPMMKPYEWQHIVDYYSATSPGRLPRPVRDSKPIPALDRFTVQTPDRTFLPPASCLVRIDTLGGRHDILVGDAKTSRLLRFDRSLRMIDSVSSKGPLVDLDLEKDRMLACNIGYLNPTDIKLGSAEFIQTVSHPSSPMARVSVPSSPAPHASGSSSATTHTSATAHANTSPTASAPSRRLKMQLSDPPLLTKLARPVQIIPADLNQDHRTDYLVCEFGNLVGSLSWMENTGKGTFTKHILRDMPGAIKAYVRDLNHDGLPDIIALFAQGDEGIFLYINKGHGQFEEKRLLRFPPVYGSTYFELADFNHDGFPDILYTCGDNADYSPVLKPYHGVYIFLNDGQNNFTQKYFFPIDGCFKAIARDFDGDGDLDIATISFFADYKNHPEEGFMYLENKGNFLFQPYTFPEAASGRWITMDAGDLYGKGKEDLVLGNFDFSSMKLGATRDAIKGKPFIVLKNKRN